MKSMILVAAVCVVLVGCSAPRSGELVGGPDRCLIGSDWGCHMWVINGYTVPGVGVNLDMKYGEIGGGKVPQIENKM